MRLKNAQKISRIVHLNKATEPKLKFIFAAKLSQLYSIFMRKICLKFCVFNKISCAEALKNDRICEKTIELSIMHR